MRATRMLTHATPNIIGFVVLILTTTAFAFGNGTTRPEASIVSGSNIDLVDIIEAGPVRAALADDPYVYAAFGSILVVLDVSDPGNPIRVGVVVLPSPCDEMGLLDGYLYCYCQGLVQVVDVNTPSLPALVGPGINAVGDRLDVDQDRLYIENFSSNQALEVFDLSDPTAPALLGTSRAPIGQEFEAQNGYVVSAYGSSSGGVKVFDATDPANPLLVGNLPIVNGAQDVDVAWPYAYAVNFAPTSSRGLYVIDVSNPAAPLQVAFYASGPFPVDNFEQIAINGNRAYVAGGTAPLGIFDISTPAAPIRLPSVVVCAGSFDQSVEVSGRLAVMKSDESLCVMDCSNPSFPIPLAHYAALPNAGGLALSPTHLVMPMGEGGLALVNREDTQQRSFFLGGREDTQTFGCAVQDDYAYITNCSFVIGIGDVIVFDISDPANPTPAGGVGVPGCPLDFTLGSNHAFVRNSSQLVSIDISDPTAPFVAGQVTIPPVIYDHDAVEPFVYVATYNDGLKAFDVSNPAAPVPVGAGLSEAALDGEPIRVAASGGYAYVIVTGPTAGLRVVDVGNPLLPTIVGNLAIPPSNSGFSTLTARDSFVYFASDGILRAIDVSDPTNPTEAGSILVGDIGSDLQPAETFIYVLGLGGQILKLEADFPTDVDAALIHPSFLGRTIRTHSTHRRRSPSSCHHHRTPSSRSST